MSRGISKIQRAIVGLLDGSVRHQVYRGSGGPLATRELWEELISLGLMRSDTPRKHAMFTVRRACRSLLDRGILQGRYVWDCDNPGRQTASWKIAEEPWD